jgi:hypothetical protein
VSPDGQEIPAPDPANIVLTAEGIVEVRRASGFGFGPGKADSVQRLARTLHDITAGQSIPAPLRLFIAKWVDAEGTHSIASFARELGYFARPNGTELLRELYERCAAFYRSPVFVHAPAAKPKAAKKTRKAAEVKPPEAEKRVPPTAATRRQRAALVAAVAASAFALVFGIAAFVAPQGQAGSSSLLASLAARAAEFGRSLGEVRTQISNLSTRLGEHLALGDEPAAPPAAAPASTAPARPRAAGRSATGGAVLPSLPVVSALPTISDAATGVVVETPANVDAPALGLTASTSGPSAAAAPAAATARDPEAVYSYEDAGVDPPKMVYPQLPPPALVLGSSSVNVMEIIVGQDGRVEKVKLVSPPRRLTDMMLLSGAKLWRFAPASVDGVPVKYRMAVSWSASVP